MYGTSRVQDAVGGDVEKPELWWLGDRLLWKPLQVTMDICEETLMSSMAVAVVGDAVAVELDCEARDRQCLFSLFAPSRRAE